MCTHDPRRDVLAIALRSIALQSANTIVIDNASTPPLDARDLEPLAGVPHRLVREPTRGVAFARARAIRESTAPWILFVDDDNELAPDYVAAALAIARAHPELGCIGGQLLPAIAIPAWFRPLASFFALDPDGLDAPRAGFVTYKWTPFDPPTAGLFVRRDIAERYLAFAPSFAALGRTAAQPASVEDCLLVRQAHPLGYQCARRPEMRLFHHVDPARFELRNALRFFYSHGGVQVTLSRLLGHGGDRHWHEAYGVAAQVARALVGKTDPRTAACLAAWELGRRRALHLRWPSAFAKIGPVDR